MTTVSSRIPLDVGLIVAVLVLEGLAVGERVALFVVGLGADVELHIVKAADVVFDRDVLGQLVAGHDVFEVAKRSVSV